MTSYRIDIRRPAKGDQPPSDWIKQTRCRSKRDAEDQAATWRSRGYEVNIVVER